MGGEGKFLCISQSLKVFSETLPEDILQKIGIHIFQCQGHKEKRSLLKTWKTLCTIICKLFPRVYTIVVPVI